jgi:hypothetical protein
MQELFSLLVGGNPIATAGLILLIAPWAFILTFRLVPRQALLDARTDRDRALLAVNKMIEASTVTNDRLADIERSLRVVEAFVTALPSPGGVSGPHPPTRGRRAG